MPKKVDICMTIQLRDYAAFEDLAEQLGVELRVQDVRELETKPTIHRRPVTAELKKWVREHHENNWSVAEFLQRCPYKTSHSTLNRLLKKYRANGAGTH